jgi:tRNA dimethylallyltransferase
MFYHQRLLGDNDRINIPPNPELRAQLEQLSLSQLQDKLSQLDSPKLASLNDSDRKNPRRLLRAIEVALYKKDHALPASPAAHDWSSLHQYLLPEFDSAALKEKITQRVLARFAAGAVDEVQAALTFPHLDSLTNLPLGFHEIASFLRGELDETAALDLWALHDWQYAKRQLTWLKSMDLL